MGLSIRLQALTDYVPYGACVIDVGTDHAYIPIYLMEKGIAKKCMATDINEGPIKKAEHNIRCHKISGIVLKQTNGLQGISENAADVIMISGMGGYLIQEILKGNLPLVKQAKQLILQPQQDIEVVRKALHHIGFKIQDENFVKDEEKYYTVINAVPGEECYESEKEYLYGRILPQKALETYKEWLLVKKEKLEAIREVLKKQDSQSAKQRKQELIEELMLHEEVMKDVFK